MNIALIVAMAENGVIGKDNTLPWHLPEDLRYFKATTMGKPIIMGRKTFESIGRALPGRTNIVISTQSNLMLPTGVLLATSVKDALTKASEVFAANQSITNQAITNEVMIIGGEKIYNLFLPQATKLYLTKVHANVDGDAYFSAYKPTDWQLISQQTYLAADKNPYDYSFCVYEKLNMDNV